MVLALKFKSEDSDVVGDAMNVFLFPDMYPAAGYEAELLMRKWDSVLGGGTLISFATTSLLLGYQKVAPVESWYKSASHLESWELFCAVLLGVKDTKHATAKIMALVVETT